MAADKGPQDTLRLQFQKMQELQFRRLQRQMEKKRDKERSLQDGANDQEELVEISHDLSLFDAGDPKLKHIFEQRVLEDEIQQLREELREAVDEKGRLYKLLKERDFEIKHLKKKMEDDRLAFTGSSAIVRVLLEVRDCRDGWRPSGHQNCGAVQKEPGTDGRVRGHKSQDEAADQPHSGAGARTADDTSQAACHGCQ